MSKENTKTHTKESEPERIARLRGQPTLYIITGPPGTPFDAWISSKPLLAPLPVFSPESGNKAMWRDANTSAIYVTSAPTRKAKEHWIAQAKKFGFLPELIVLDPGKDHAKRLITRDVLPAQKPRLSKTVTRWYTAYEKHPDEERINIHGYQPVRQAASA